MRSLAILAVAMAPAGATSLRSHDPFVMGHNILADGDFRSGEWSDAKPHELSRGVTILTKRWKDILLIGVRLPKNELRYVDLYFEDATGRKINLHASQKQGERLLPPNWTERVPPFVWGPFATWQTNIAERWPVAPDTPLERALKPYQGYEIRIPTAHLGPGPWRMRIEVRDFLGAKPDVVLPRLSRRVDTDGWLAIAATP